MNDYQTIIETYRAALPPGRLEHFHLAPIDRIGLPFQLLTFYQHGGPTNAGSGYGMSAEEAFVGALGELNEVVNAHAALQTMPREGGNYRAMLARYGASHVADPRTLCLDAGANYTPETALQWVATRRYGTDDVVYVPLEFVACQGADVPPAHYLITPITNGLGAGLSYNGAVGHGLLELIQRDGNSVNFRALAGDTALTLDEVCDADTLALLRQLDQLGVDVVAKLASTDFGLANMYVVGMDRLARNDASPIMGLACGEAAHPNREYALRKALLEFVAARARVGFSHGPLGFVRAVTPPGYLEMHMQSYNPACDEARALESMRALARLSLEELRPLLEQRVLKVSGTTSFSALPTHEEASTTHDEREAIAQTVAERLQTAGFDILVADFSPLNSPVHVVKVIVPGLEVETMSYHRIGERNLQRLLDRGESFVHVGNKPQRALRIHLTEQAEARIGGSAWLDPAALDAVVGPLYPLYREPARHAVAWLAEAVKG